MTRVALVFGTLFGSGLSPVMPGTCGSIVALLMVAWIPGDHYGHVTAALAILATAFGPALAERLMARSGQKDPPQFVLDEGAGIWIAAFRPENPGWGPLLLAFVVFRVLDMTKPWLVGRAERLPGGYGVVYDDVVAGFGALALSWTLEISVL